MLSIVVGTAGHIDHGKSALVRVLTGIDPDRLKEEKDRGITIDLGFAHMVEGGSTFAFVDVPGHERFVKNMLAGVGGVDLVLLVVAATESVMPQTREHFEICRLLHVPAGVVALTKADLVGADRIAEVAAEVRDLVAGSFLEHAPVVPVSSVDGRGLAELRQALSGVARTARRPTLDGIPRVPIDRVFSIKGFGTVVTGTVVSGRVSRGDTLAILPGGRPAVVRGVQVHGLAREYAEAGERAAVNLTGVAFEQLVRGDTLTSADGLTVTEVADVVLDVIGGAAPVRQGARVRVHQGTVEILGRIVFVGPPVSGTEPVARPGSRVFARLRLERPAALTRGDRYIVRAYSPVVTVGGGWVLDPRPPHIRTRSAAALDRCRRLGATEPDTREAGLEAAAVMVEDAALAALSVGELVARAAIAPGAVEACACALAERGVAERVGDLLVDRKAFERLAHDLVELLAGHHRAQPLLEGMPRETVRSRVARRAHPLVFDRVLNDLTRGGTVTGTDRLALASHRVEVPAEDVRLMADVERTCRGAGLAPPSASTLSLASPPAGGLEQVVKRLVREKRLVSLDGLLFHPETLASLKRDVAALKADGKTRLDVAAFKQRFGVSRKFAIPLLEYLDRERVTRRVGESREIL